MLDPADARASGSTSRQGSPWVDMAWEEIDMVGGGVSGSQRPRTGTDRLDRPLSDLDLRNRPRAIRL